MKPPKDTPTALPIYLQISETLSREIAAGRLADGERLPPERELAKQYGTTVRTLRKSLDKLANEGFLKRIQGSGNYVQHKPDAKSIYSMFRLELHGGGGLPHADILDVTELDKPADLPEFGTSDRGTRIRRLRYLDQTVIAVEEIWLDRNSGAIAPEALSDSLYRFYQMKLGFWITRAEDRVSIDTVPDWAPDAFGKAAGTTTAYIERFSWAQEAAPVEFSRTWYDTDKALYIQRLI